ncbi:MAG: hypothetical protein VYD90_12725 [Pseudomonadota bacterium]|nr:hypothetical protein [Pseudomonadota bacterium]
MGIRNVLRRWLGVPSDAEIREIVLREVDADAVWIESAGAETFAAQRQRRAARRESGITWGKRENTRV